MGDGVKMPVKKMFNCSSFGTTGSFYSKKKKKVQMCYTGQTSGAKLYIFLFSLFEEVTNHSHFGLILSMICGF